MSERFIPSSTPPFSLAHKRVLIVEDEFLIADEIAYDFESYGAEVVGPISTVARAMDVIASGLLLDGAVIDIDLEDDKAFPLVDALRACGVPCAFATGYDLDGIPPAYRDIPFCQKPVSPSEIAQLLFPLTSSKAVPELS
ncbi:response regulator [Aureimonas endophytica]|nr:response regulator [Aureimonas endophytica]